MINVGEPSPIKSNILHGYMAPDYVRKQAEWCLRRMAGSNVPLWLLLLSLASFDDRVGHGRISLRFLSVSILHSNKKANQDGLCHLNSIFIIMYYTAFAERLVDKLKFNTQFSEFFRITKARVHNYHCTWRTLITLHLSNRANFQYHVIISQLGTVYFEDFIVTKRIVC